MFSWVRREVGTDEGPQISFHLIIHAHNKFRRPTGEMAQVLLPTGPPPLSADTWLPDLPRRCEQHPQRFPQRPVARSPRGADEPAGAEPPPDRAAHQAAVAEG
jgi:hypothetical protein